VYREDNQGMVIRILEYRGDGTLQDAFHPVAFHRGMTDEDFQAARRNYKLAVQLQNEYESPKRPSKRNGTTVSETATDAKDNQADQANA